MTKPKDFIKRTTLKHALKIGPVEFAERYLFPAMRREHGDGFAMSTWRSSYELYRPAGLTAFHDGVRRAIPVCKSVMCIGGTLNVILGTADERILGRALGLPAGTEEALFYGWQRRLGVEGAWPKTYQDLFSLAETAIQKERIAEVVVLLAIHTKGACFLRTFGN